MIINNKFLQQVVRTFGQQTNVAISVTRKNVRKKTHVRRTARILAIYAWMKNFERIKKWGSASLSVHEFLYTGEFLYTHEYSSTNEFSTATEFSYTLEYLYSHEFSSTYEYLSTHEFLSTSEYSYTHEILYTTEFLLTITISTIPIHREGSIRKGFGRRFLPR